VCVCVCVCVCEYISRYTYVLTYVCEQMHMCVCIYTDPAHEVATALSCKESLHWIDGIQKTASSLQ